MIENSKRWAAQRGLVEKSEVHGLEEWRIPISRTFEHESSDVQTSKQSATFFTQDRSLILYAFVFASTLQCIAQFPCKKHMYPRSLT